MSAKNIIVLAMSTLPGSVKSVQEIRPSKFTWEDNGGEEYEYLSQLEPISTMIKKKEGSLDRVIILATKETLEKVYDAEGEKISAVDFYRKRMGLTDEATEIVDVAEDDFVPAISQTVKEIRQYWKENTAETDRTEDAVHLWIDTQGSFRNINLVLNAVITLLKRDGIVPSGIYSLNYNAQNKIQQIKDQTNTYKIFGFVSGINEFTQSGRAEQLTEYYRQIGQPVPESIVIMGNIAEAIQMCDMGAFDQQLEKFRKLHKKEGHHSGDDLLEMFREQIQRDYGKLLEDDCTGLAVIKWFYGKGFYQQAITYIESKMPGEWKKKGILSWENGKTTLQKLKDTLRKKNEKDENVLLSQLVMQCFQWNALCWKNKSGKVQYADLKKLSDGIRVEYTRPESLHPFKVETRKGSVSQYIGTIDVDIHCKNKMRVMRLFLLYKLLKNERNKFNHMAENDVRADKAHLGEAINLFIKTGEAVYNDIC